MSDFEYVMEDGTAAECESCRSTAPLANFPEPPTREDRFICEVCASTIIGRVLSRKTRLEDSNHRELIQIVAQTANAMLDMILKRKPHQ